MLIYTGVQLVWRCLTLLDCVGGHIYWPNYSQHAPILALGPQAPLKMVDHSVSLEMKPASLKLISAQPVVITRELRDWMRTVQLYSERQLSDLADRLTAIGGVAEQFQLHIGDDYYVGLWRKNILPSLT
jgi:hypothetical protein